MRTRKSLVLLAAVLIAVLAVAAQAVAQPRAGEAAQSPAQIDLVLQLRCPDGTCRPSLSLGGLIEKIVLNIGSSGEDGVRYQVDSFFDVFFVRNIGSSGQDGVSFDSFFDITYEIRSIDIELVALSLRATYSGDLNPALVIDEIRSVAGVDVTYGHVTILK
jgi:hypothetical protein